MNIAFVLGIAAVSFACKSEKVEVSVKTEPAETEPAKPKTTTRQRLEGSLRKHFEKYGFTTFTCPEVGPTEDKTTCKMTAENGVSFEAPYKATKKDSEGRWSSWDLVSDNRVSTADKLVEGIRDGVGAEVKKAHPKATYELACGTGPIVFTKEKKTTCKLTMKNPEKVVEISVDGTGEVFKWSADAF